MPRQGGPDREPSPLSPTTAEKVVYSPCISPLTQEEGWGKAVVKQFPEARLRFVEPLDTQRGRKNWETSLRGARCRLHRTSTRVLVCVE